MIEIEKSLQLQFSSIGRFETYAEWIHPCVTVDTYELILVLAGDVKIYEGERQFCAHPGQMLLLEPGVEHGGYERNVGHTAFYWLHFSTNEIAAWGIPKLETAPHNAEKALRELMHLWQTQKSLAEITLAKFLLENRAGAEYKNKLAYEVREYVRVHARESLRVDAVARHFGYSADHLSRLFRREFGYDLKEGIVRQRLAYAESLLINTDYSVKEIAATCGFEDENLFVKFFKYHEKITPVMYRNRFFGIHMNNR
ncbi:MAG: helix-turn-helix transcriptional regulator [Clostridia bacterium]|nr:helix-turn-helix transcriptional regulator [Clostridia bacterium]